MVGMAETPTLTSSHPISIAYNAAMQDHVVPKSTEGRDATLSLNPSTGVVPQDPYETPISSQKTSRSHEEQSIGMIANAMGAVEDIMLEVTVNTTSVDQDLTTCAHLDITQADVADIPQLQELYETYQASYVDSAITNDTRMMHAKAFALALLQHCYPTSRDYIVEPSSLGPIAKHGLSFIRAMDDGSDVWQDLSVNKAAKKGNRKGRLTKTQKEIAKISAKSDQYNHGLRYMLNLQWDWIEPEDIAGFVVLRKMQTNEEERGTIGYEYRPHTYLAILIDHFDTLPLFSSANITHRSDVLTDALCRDAKIQQGYGILLYGQRIEFYSYDAGAEWANHDDDEIVANGNIGESVSDEKVQDIEPIMQLFCRTDGSEDFELDIRTKSLQEVMQCFRTVSQHQVIYIDDVVSGGIE